MKRIKNFLALIFISTLFCLSFTSCDNNSIEKASTEYNTAQDNFQQQLAKVYSVVSSKSYSKSDLNKLSKDLEQAFNALKKSAATLEEALRKDGRRENVNDLKQIISEQENTYREFKEALNLLVFFM